MEPYSIVAPPYVYAQTSAGVRALYTLALELKARGQDVRIVEQGVSAKSWRGIVVYSETVAGNPLGSANVVRWTLNKPGYLGGDATYGPAERVWTWSKAFYDAPLLTVETIDRGLFYTDDTMREFDTAYYGKALQRGVERVPLTRHMREIDRTPWPARREDLADLLHRTRTLYTYDDCTALIDEASLCGCRVVLLPEGTDITRKVEVIDHAARIDAFVQATQA